MHLASLLCHFAVIQIPYALSGFKGQKNQKINEKFQTIFQSLISGIHHFIDNARLMILGHKFTQ
jgi:hypothetical protein